MRVERIRVWQWCLIGIAVGFAMAFIRLASLPKEEPGLEPVAPHVFETHLLGGTDPSRKPVLGVRNIVLHPPADIMVPGERSAITDYVTYDVWLPEKVVNGKPQGRWWPRQLIIESAVRAHHSLVGSLEGMTLPVYLEKLKAALASMPASKKGQNATPLDYKFNWYETPRAAYTIFPTACFLVIGVIWPMVLGALVRKGFGRAPEEADLASYRGKIPQKATTGKKEMSEADLDQLARLEAELESGLKGGDVSAKPGAGAKPSEAPVPVLSAGPLEAPKDEPTRHKPKGYGADQGDYYPTEVHGKRPG